MISNVPDEGGDRLGVRLAGAEPDRVPGELVELVSERVELAVVQQVQVAQRTDDEALRRQLVRQEPAAHSLDCRCELVDRSLAPDERLDLVEGPKQTPMVLSIVSTRA